MNIICFLTLRPCITFYNLCKELINENTLVYICIDGVPSKAKIITQRKRSYIGKFISKNKKDILENHKKKLDINPDSFNNLPYNQ